MQLNFHSFYWLVIFSPTELIINLTLYVIVKIRPVGKTEMVQTNNNITQSYQLDYFCLDRDHADCNYTMDSQLFYRLSENEPGLNWSGLFCDEKEIFTYKCTIFDQAWWKKVR